MNKVKLTVKDHAIPENSFTEECDYRIEALLQIESLRSF